MSREEAAQEELREGERGYDAAEARKGALLQQETAAWEALGELCRKCSVARRELTRRAGAEEEARLVRHETAVVTEEARLQAEESLRSSLSSEIEAKQANPNPNPLTL